MAETVMLDASAPGPRVHAAGTLASPTGTAGQRLHLAVLRMAGRLAVLLEELAPASPEPAFLRSMAEEAGAGGIDGSVLDLPAAAAAQPVDRVAACLGLDALDLDLLVLAALPGEREGLAAVVRTLHPEHRPAVTGGLAAALAGAGLIGALPRSSTPTGRRETVRERLTSGLLGRSGLVRLDRRRCAGRTCGLTAAGHGRYPSPRRGSPGGRALARRWRPGKRSACSSRWWQSPAPRARTRPRPGWPCSPNWPAGLPGSCDTRRPRPAGWRGSPCTHWRAA